MRLHIRLNGQTRVFDSERLGFAPSPDNQALKQQLQRVLELPAAALSAAVIDRHPEQIVVRPAAVFG